MILYLISWFEVKIKYVDDDVQYIWRYRVGTQTGVFINQNDEKSTIDPTIYSHVKAGAHAALAFSILTWLSALAMAVLLWLQEWRGLALLRQPHCFAAAGTVSFFALLAWSIFLGRTAEYYESFNPNRIPGQVASVVMLNGWAWVFAFLAWLLSLVLIAAELYKHFYGEDEHQAIPHSEEHHHDDDASPEQHHGSFHRDEDVSDQQPMISSEGYQSL